MDWIHDLGRWIADNFAAVANFVFAGTVAVAAVVSAHLTRKLVRETIQLRKAETDPFVAVYIESQRIEPFFFDMVIRNVARGSAYDVSFDPEPVQSEWVEVNPRKRHLPYPGLDQTLFRDGIAYMAPGQEIRFFFGSYVELPKRPVKIVVTFFGEPGRQRRRTQFRETYTIDICQFEGMGHVREAPEKTVEGVGQDRGGPRTYPAGWELVKRHS